MEIALMEDSILMSCRENISLRMCKVENFDAVRDVSFLLDMCADSSRTVTHIYYTIDWDKKENDGNLGRFGNDVGFAYTDGTYSIYSNRSRKIKSLKQEVALIFLIQAYTDMGGGQ